MASDQEKERCTPEPGESEDDFIGRCIGIMTSKGKDSSQAAAICHSIWDDKKSIKIPNLRFSNSLERRYLPVAEFRVEEEEGEPVLVGGYAAVFERWSEDLGFFKEKIQKGAFSKTILEHDIRALINHDPNLIIGRTRNKTLKLWEDDEGLGFEVKLPETSYAKDLATSIKRKDITQNSFGFQVVQDEWSKDGKRRTLREVRLFDVSPVTFPAYKQTSVKLRLYSLGIDYEALEAALLRTQENAQTEEDIQIIHSVTDILSRYLPSPEEPPAAAGDSPGHSPEPTEPELASTLIRLRMAERICKQYGLGGKDK